MNILEKHPLGISSKNSAILKYIYVWFFNFDENNGVFFDENCWLFFENNKVHYFLTMYYGIRTY